eukprot:TRINITY_DN27424_c0_g2_i1.p1 TRINITY_DN27424_c0_g2~~TRINITY_DN27424_c0_g2_i1.p1  ORF type:complete len:500 (-),score=108.87 TRINITY_DN27424_c0_g2_i1:64-1563(-)
MQALNRATEKPRGATSAGPGLDNMGLTLYKEPPQVELSVRDFEELALDRLKLLHAFDRVCGHDSFLSSIPDARGALTKDLDETRLNLVWPGLTTAAMMEKYMGEKAAFIRRDTTSHFALRLAFCKTRESRDWFVRQEQRLFVLRFDALSPEGQEAFLKDSGVRCRRLQQNDLKDSEHMKELVKTTAGAKIFKSDGKMVHETIFYEMPFMEVHPSLVGSRRVVLRDGKAYVPGTAIKVILAGRFKERLNEALDVAYRALPNVIGDPRVGSFLRLLQDHGMQLLVATKSNSEDVGDKLSLENFEELMVRSFPPCMRRLVERQREMKKHLKHAGRLQLRPFLKECGFTLEEATRWWKQEICRDPEVDSTVFDKNYTYDIEHTYGKKGHFQGQNSFGCPKIIGFPGEAGTQVHGCPFKTLDVPFLKQQLHRWGVPFKHLAEIEKLVSNGKHYQLACIEYFKGKHPESQGNGVGNTPSDFWRESCRFHAAGGAGGKATAGAAAT